MAYTNTSSSFTSLAFRQDSDAKTWIKAKALTDLTAGTPYLCFVGRAGYEAQAVYDTGVIYPGSTTAGYHWAYVGVPAEAVTSDESGWLQVGGYNASVTLANEATVSAGNAIMWLNASMQSSGATYTAAVNEWAVGAADTDAGGTAFPLVQVPDKVSGTT